MSTLGVLVIFVLAAHLAASQEWKRTQFNRHEYLFGVDSPDIENTWHSARAICQGYGGDLVSITYEDEKDFIYQNINDDMQKGSVWIGLNYLDRTTWKWTDRYPDVPNYWAEGYPTENGDMGALHLCANQKAQESGQWYNSHCDDTMGYICERFTGDTEPITDGPTKPVAGYCPTGYFGVGNKCYRVVQIKTGEEGITWQEAALECRKGPGVAPDLASIHSQYENAIIMSQMQQKGLALWIGYHRDRTWRWTDNSESSEYDNWAVAEPGFGRDCAVLWNVALDPGTWSSMACNYKQGYVCQTYKSAKDVIFTPNPTTPNTCPRDYTPYWYGCYKLYSDTYEWSEAQSKCEVDGGNLVSIHSAAEDAAIFASMFETTSSIWIGLNTNETLEKYTWSDGWHVLYTAWGHGQPNQKQGGGCVAMRNDGKWYDTPCNNKLPSICKITDAEPLTTPAHLEGQCPGEDRGDTIWEHYGQYCYYFEHIGSATWEGANIACGKLSPIAYLASVHDHLENEFITMTMYERNEKAYPWIGMFRSLIDGDFYWVDATRVQYTHWAEGEPENGNHTKQDCVSMYTKKLDGVWDADKCDHLLQYVCKAPKVPHPTPPPTRKGKCPSGWVNSFNNCYYFEPNHITRWNDAHTQCLSLSDNKASLASIDSVLENEFVFTEMTFRNELPEAANYWIGFVKNGPLTEENEFYWVDSTEVEYTSWSYGQPADYLNKEDCTEVMRPSSHWNNLPCEEKKPFVCKMAQFTVDEGSSSLSSGSIVGIIIGVFVAVVLIVLIAVVVLDHFKIIDVSQKAANAKALFDVVFINSKQEDTIDLEEPADAKCNI